MSHNLWVKCGPDEWEELEETLELPRLHVGEVIHLAKDTGAAYRVECVRWMPEEEVFSYYLSGFDAETGREWFPDEPRPEPRIWFKLYSQRDYTEELQARFHLKVGDTLQIGLATVEELVDLGNILGCSLIINTDTLELFVADGIITDWRRGDETVQHTES